MRLPFLKPHNYEHLSFQNKMNFISSCYKQQNQLHDSYTKSFFGGVSDFNIFLLNRIHTCLKDYYPPSYSIWRKTNPENTHDLEAAYDIVRQFLLSNAELIEYVNERLKDENLSPNLVSQIKQIVSQVKDEWELYCKKVGFTNKNSKEIRNTIKLSSVGCSSLSLLCCGVGFFSAGITATSIAAYAVSGQCADSLALVSARQQSFSQPGSGRIGQPQSEHQIATRMPGYLKMIP